MTAPSEIVWWVYPRRFWQRVWLGWEDPQPSVPYGTVTLRTRTRTNRHETCVRGTHHLHRLRIDLAGDAAVFRKREGRNCVAGDGCRGTDAVYRSITCLEGAQHRRRIAPFWGIVGIGPGTEITVGVQTGGAASGPSLIHRSSWSSTDRKTVLPSPTFRSHRGCVQSCAPVPQSRSQWRHSFRIATPDRGSRRRGMSHTRLTGTHAKPVL